MRRFQVVLLAILFVSEGSIVRGTTGQSATPPVKVACVGDSITVGFTIKDAAHDSYPAQLQKMLGDRYAVINFGHSSCTLLAHGDHPYKAEKEFSAALADAADIVVIALGTNDSKVSNWKFKSEFDGDYATMIAKFRLTNPKVQIYLCKPPPAFPGRWLINESVISNEVCPAVTRVAIANHTRLIDLHTPMLHD